MKLCLLFLFDKLEIEGEKGNKFQEISPWTVEDKHRQDTNSQRQQDLSSLLKIQ